MGAIRVLDLLAIGMVNDNIYVESRNDSCPEAYVELATQTDLTIFEYVRIVGQSFPGILCGRETLCFPQ